MSMTDLPGSSLLASRYRLVERLGAGGMSVVWRGFDEVLGRQVAVKVLPPSTSTDPVFRRRLRAEAQAAARLSHPNITNVYDYGEATTVDGEPVPYVVMELIDGESLAAVLARVRRLPWPAAVRITAEVAAALAAAHARGIVHRDVTPANVMLTSSGAKVVDFGISALIGENDIDPDGSLLGTPAYLAPERLEGGQVSPATDVYAVGLLIYRTLIGQLPWDVGTTTALLRAHQYTEPEPLPPVEGLPSVVVALVDRCLQKDPADRPSSAELAHVLAGVSADAGRADPQDEDWSVGSGEDTTILPSQRVWSDGFRRDRSWAVPRPASPGPVAVGDGPASAAGPVPPVAARAAVPVPNVPAAAPEALEHSDRRPASGVAANATPRNSRFRSASGILPSATSGPLRPAFSGPPSGNERRPRSGFQSPSGSGAGRLALSSKVHTRRVLLVAAAVFLVTVATYGWSLANSSGKSDNDRAGSGSSVVEPTGRCVVSYAVWSDADGKFSAHVTLANRDTAALTNWKLWFILPGDQVLSGNGKVQLAQQDRAVTLTSSAALDPQEAVTMPITGRYAQNNAAPLVFQLNGETCETYVSSKPGAPSQKVEHLSNGEVRLQPTPATPGPGITLDPSGVVHITPTPTVKPTDQGSGPTATVTAKPAVTTTTAGPALPSPPDPGGTTSAADHTTQPTAAATTGNPAPPTIPDEPCVPDDPACLGVG